MKPLRQDQLTKLIHSLSTNEKRYFKLFTADTSGDKNYQKLFNAIDAEKITDPKALKKRMSGSSMNLSYEKGYLQKILMRALRNFHEDASIEIALHQTLIDIEILFNKQHYDLCMLLVKKSMPLADENEHYTMVLQLVKWHRRITVRKGLYHEVAKENNKLSQIETDCLKKIENLSIYKGIQGQMLGQLSQKGNARQREEMVEFKRIIQHPYLKDEAMALTYSAKLLFFESWGWYYQHTLQMKKAYEMCHRTVNFIEQYPEKIRLHPQAYMACLSSLVNRCSNLSKYDEALKVIAKMERIPEIKGVKVPKSLQTEILTFSIERRLMIYGFSRQFKKGIELYEKTKVEIEKNRKDIRPTFLSLYYELTAMCYFYLQQYDKALQQLRVLLDEVDDTQRSDSFLYAHMLHILTHFELKNYELLPYLIKSTRRFATSRGFTQETVSLFLKMFADLAKNNSKAELKEIITAYLPKFKKTNKINADSVIQGTIDLEYWMKGKLSG